MKRAAMLILVCASQIESALGTFPLPPVVGIAASSQVAVRMTPKRAFEPALIRVTVQIEPSDDNRYCDVVVEGPHFRRAWRLDLPDGRREARTTQREYDNVPGGAYTITAVLQRQADRVRAVETFCVVPRFADGDPCE